MKPIHFGFTLPQLPTEPDQRAAFVDDVNRALELVSGHFESARMIDHLDKGDIESFTTLAYFAALHPRLKFGHMVLCQSFRHPALVARMGAAMQFLTGGRYLFGIGAGWNEPEYRANGYDFPSARRRVEQLDEALQIIIRLWAGETVTFPGAYYRTDQAAIDPKPVPPPPVMVGAFRPKMLRLTAKYADEWNVSSTGISKYERLVKEFDLACKEEGRDPAAVVRSWGGGCACMPTLAEAERIGGDRYSSANKEEDFGFVGTPQHIIQQMRQFIDLGVTAFYVDCGGFPNLTTLELIVNEVLPEFV